MNIVGNMNELNGFYFWENLDRKKGKFTIKNLAEQTGIPYSRLKNQRSDTALPKIEDAYLLAKAIGVSVDYLLTGEEATQTYPPRIQAIIEILLDDENKLNAVCTLLQIPTEEAGISGTKAV